MHNETDAAAARITEAIRSTGEKLEEVARAIELLRPAIAARLERENEVLRIERDHSRRQFSASVELLCGIHHLLYPAPATRDDGVTFVFRPQNPHEFMQELSDRIRALPNEIESIRPATRASPSLDGGSTPPASTIKAA